MSGTGSSVLGRASSTSAFFNSSSTELDCFMPTLSWGGHVTLRTNLIAQLTLSVAYVGK